MANVIGNFGTVQTVFLYIAARIGLASALLGSTTFSLHSDGCTGTAPPGRSIAANETCDAEVERGVQG